MGSAMHFQVGGILIVHLGNVVDMNCSGFKIRIKNVKHLSIILEHVLRCIKHGHIWLDIEEGHCDINAIGPCGIESSFG
jgi:hypothetical protein